MQKFSIGMITARDRFVIDFEKTPLLKRVTEFQKSTLSDEELCEYLGIPMKKGWDIGNARKLIQQEKDLTGHMRLLLYRPFDIRHIFYHRSLVWSMSYPIMRNMLGNNLALITSRMTKGEAYQHTLASNTLSEVILLSPKTSNNAYVFPLYLYPAEKKEQPDKSRGEGTVTQDVMSLQTKREPNLNPDFIKAFSEKLDLKFVEDGKGDLKETFGPEDIFNYAYAVFHSPTYRTRYTDFLKIDFPRLQLTSDKELFKALADKGAALVSLHLMESPTLNTLITKYRIDGTHIVEKVCYDEKTQRVYINKAQYFEDVPPSVWNFHIGGYQVCEKWLKDRQKAHRKLSVDDITHYQKIVVALKETIRLMTEIDALIPEWPIT